MTDVQTLPSWANQISMYWWGMSKGLFIQSSVLILLVWGLDVFLRRRVHAGFRYGLWMLVLVKLMLPPTLVLPTSIAYWWAVPLPSVSETERGNDEPWSTLSLADDVTSGMLTESPTTRSSALTAVVPSRMQYVLWLWALGVAVLLTVVIQRLFFVRNLFFHSRPAEGHWQVLLAECRQQAGVKNQVRLLFSPMVTSPAVCGLLKPTILLPAHLEQVLTETQLKEVLFHELIHVLRKDLWINLMQTCLNALYFYHPLVWLANSRIHALREYAVDEAVLARLKRPADQYSQTLVDVAQKGYGQPNLGLRLVGVAECKHQLRGRITHMLNLKSLSNLGGRLSQLLIIIALGLLILPMARAVDEPQKDAKSLNPQQQAYQRWTQQQFGSLLDCSRYADMSPEAQAELVGVWLDDLKTPSRRIQAINGLAEVGGKQAVKPLLAIAAERVEKNNRERWMATRALGLLGDTSVVPDLIHLTYHYNQNTRFWAQISLVRLTGQNFGAKWRQWGMWWNRQGGDPACELQPVVWTQNEEWADLRKQAQDDREFWEQSNGPDVVKTTPAVFSTDVSSDLTEITVTFNQVMKDGGWSWTGGGETFPSIAGDIAYDRSKRTCHLPVKLEPGKVYRVGINSPSHQNFRSRRGVPAKRYVILFATAAADGSPTVIPEEMIDFAEQINGVDDVPATD